MELENSFKKAYEELITSFIELENDLTTNFNDELLLDLYFTELKKIVSYKAIVYIKYNEDEDRYVIIKEEGYVKFLKKRRKRLIADGIVKWAARLGKPFVLTGDDYVRTHIILPVLSQGVLVGAFLMETDFDENYFDQNKTRILQIIGNRISIAFENRELYKNLEKRNHKLRALKNYLDTVIVNMTDGIFVIDEKGKVVVFNRELEQILSCRKRDFVGKAFENTPFSDDFKEKMSVLIARAKVSKFLLGEIDYIKELEVIPFGYHIKCIEEDYGFTGVLIVLRNLKETKELMELKRIDKLKDEFVSMVSHELRTPLTSIKAYTETLMDMAEDESIEKEFLSIINEESDRLNRLINDILDLSKIEAGKMDFFYEKQNVNSVIEKAILNMKSFASSKNIIIEGQLNNTIKDILIDKDRILQVLLNIINNSIKFTFEGDRVIVRTVDLEDSILIEVEDHGNGIDEDKLELIFEKFSQVQNVMTRSIGGTGLGLPICRKIVEEHYGKIWVESKKNIETIFKIKLPKDK